MNNGSTVNLEGDVASAGVQGYSAYDLYVQQGGTLSLESWLNSFLTPDGYVLKNDIIDNLTSTSTIEPLSANQGKNLKTLIDDNTDDITALTTSLTNEITARENADAVLDAKITNVASGSPLVASSTSGMTDTTRTYVNTTDGNWYYYNGEEWAIGGVYQATVSDFVDTDELLKSLYLNDNSSVVENLLFRVGSGIRTDNGKIYDNEHFIRTGRLETKRHGKLFVLDSDTYLMGIRFYNDNMSSDWTLDFLGYKTWNNLVYASIYPRVALVFKRVDGEEVTNSDLDIIKTKLKIYELTDKTLSYSSVPADAKIVGDIVNNIKDDYFKKCNNKSYTIDFNDYYPSASATSYNLTYDAKGWIGGYLNGGEGQHGISESYRYLVTRYDISQIKGSIPKFIKVKINDISELSYPYIKLGWYDDTQNQTIHLSEDKDEVVIEVPSYPNLENTTGGLYLTVGRFPAENDPTTAEEMEYRVLEWVSENVEVTFYFDEYLNDREFVNNKFITNSFLYNSTYDYALKIPKNYKAYSQEKTPLLILCHGYSSTITPSEWGSSEDMISLVNTFTNNGYAVMDVGQVTTADWCNPNLIKKYVTAIKHITTNYNVEPQFIFGESMGSLIALTLQQQYNIKAIAIGGPRLDFEYVYNNASSADKTIISNNLGFADGFDSYIASGWCKTLYEVTDSSNNKVNVNQLPPTFYLYGSSDTQVAEATAKMEAIKRGGNIVKSKTYESNHHNICYLKTGVSLQDTLDWYDTWK